MSTNTPTANGRKLSAKSAEAIRNLFFETVTEEDLKNMIRKLIDIAVEGHFPAIKFILPYLIGKPGQAPTMDDLNQAARQDGKLAATKSRWDAGLPPITASDLVAAGRSPKPGDASEIRLANKVGAKHNKRK